MNKRHFIAPYVMLTSGGDPIIGGHTGQGGIVDPDDPTPMSYAAWFLSDWKEDYDGSGDIEPVDCAIWWLNCGFTPEQWNALNPPDCQWNDEWNGLLG